MQCMILTRAGAVTVDWGPTGTGRQTEQVVSSWTHAEMTFDLVMPGAQPLLMYRAPETSMSDS